MFTYIAIGIVILVIFKLLLADKIDKKWGYEAEFLAQDGREIGEIEMELSHNNRLEEKHMLKINFKFKHPQLKKDDHLEIFVENDHILTLPVNQNGFIKVRVKKELGDIQEPKLGQACKVMRKGKVLKEAKFIKD